MRRKITHETWEQVKTAFAAGIGLREIGRNNFSAVIEADLRVVFYIDGDNVYTVDIGSHRIYG